MSTKQSKKIRKVLKKSCDEIARGKIGQAAYKVAKQRDFIFLAAVSGWAGFIAFVILWVIK